MVSRAAEIARAPVVQAEGVWQRHVSARHSDAALDGRRGYQRWGTPEGFPVLYLGRPTESVVVEAYRHLVDPVEDMLPPSAFSPRVLVTATVQVPDVVDLRTAAGRMHVGLTLSDLQSATDDRDAYRRCQEVAQIAHQLGRLGVLAPAATGIGETLALFSDLLKPDQRPQRSADDQLWAQLPFDPRVQPRPALRVIRDHD